MNQLFQVYKSSAGSGKTFTLVKEYLKLCLKAESHFHFSSILAITFTNKATLEMKERLLGALKSISENESDDLVSLLVQETAMEETQIREKCQFVLTNILHNYGDFSISTIDRFTHRLIRTFAKDLGLPLNFQVEIDPKRILEESVERLIQGVGIDRHLSNMLFAFAYYKIEENKSWRIDEDLIDFAKLLLDDQNSIYIEGLKKCKQEDFIQLRKTYQKQNKEFVSQLNAICEKANQLILDSGIDASMFYRGKTGIYSYFDRNTKGFSLKSVEANSYVRTTIEEDKWYASKATSGDKLAIDGISIQLKEGYYEVQNLLESELANYLGREAVIKSLYTLSLLTLIEKQMGAFKKEERILPIADFNKKIAEVVLQEPMPFIYERLGDKYNHYMIDEFQDTSELQFMNLLPLIEESLGRGKMNLIVGDAKQAIYRFRGGEMKQLAEMPNYRPKNFEDNPWVSQRLETLESQYQELELAKNWRSKDEVVKFNNAFFQFISTHEQFKEGAGKVFTDYKQEVKADLKQGMIDIFILEDKSKESHLEQTLVDVLEAVNDGYSYSDIAVLCSQNKDASLVANYLQQKNIPVISSEALLIKSAPQVRFLINLSKWIFNQEDVLAQKGILVFLSEAGMLKGEIDKHLNWCIKNENRLVDYLADYGFNLNLINLKLMPLHALFEELIRTFELNKKFDLYVQFLQEEVYAFSQNNGNNFNAFLEYWEEKNEKLALDIPADINAVEVLTIHKSKGLEFPVVIMPFISSQARKVKGYLWVKPSKIQEAPLPYALVEAQSDIENSAFAEKYHEEKEQVNSDFLHQTYVAFTRAADRLYLRANALSKKGNEESLANLLLQFASEEHLEKVDEEHERFIWGKRQNKSEINKVEESKEVSLPFQLSYHSSPWFDKLKISREAEQEWELLDQDGARVYGNLLHELLAKVTQPSKAKEVVNEYFRSGKINSVEAKQLLDKLKEILTNSKLQPFLNPQLKRKREATLMTEKGKILRPDLVVMDNDYWAVIDYKTGEKSEAHQAQVLEYVAVLKQMTELPIEPYLFYTESGELVKV
tara:strand:+ start:127875 stop:131036 length:3162 start_codon:yes stop_codon:yes gene_type:complete